jgi:sodium-dependent dicarboxylate transporter 2/3/5
MSSAPTSPVMKPATRCAILAAALVAGGLTIFLLPGHSGWPREAVFMAGIFVLAAILWATEALPLFATALLVIGLEIILLANPGGWPSIGYAAGESPDYQEILHAAADPILLLFFGGFLLAQAAAKEGVDHAVSSLLLAPFEKNAKTLLLGVLCVTAAFSMWMSNTATAAMMIALVAPIIARLPPGEPFRKALILAVSMGANLGGLGTPIASPPNAVAVGFLRQAGYPVGFLDWMLVGVPLMAGLILFAWLLLWRLFPPRMPGLKLGLVAQRPSGRALYVVGVFATTVILWLSEPWHGLPAAVVALLPAIALTAPGILNRDDLNRLPWNILILIGGGIALGAGMQMTGLDHLLVEQLPSHGEGPWLLATLVIATVVIGTFMSNTAVANLLLPIGISTAGSGSPVLVAVSIALAACVSMALPISTPPNAIAYASGEIGTRDLARLGLATGVIAIVWILVVLGPMMGLIGM